MYRKPMILCGVMVCGSNCGTGCEGEDVACNEDFEMLENVEKLSYVLDSELWESKFNGLLSLVKEYIVDVWEIRKHKLYDSDSGSGLQLHTQSSPGERSGKFSQDTKLRTCRSVSE